MKLMALMSDRRRYLLLFALIPLLLSLSACKWEQKREWSRNRQKWQAQNLTDYRYKVSIISYWGENESMPLTMSYRGGQLVSVMDKDGNELELDWNKTSAMDAIFDEIEIALSKRNRDVTEVAYDPLYGFPMNVDIYYHDKGVGGEYSRSYTVSHFEVLSNP